MKVKYFKTGIYGDCYISGNNVASISDSHTCSMGASDADIRGLYKPLEVSKKEYNSLIEGVNGTNRKKVTGLLKKIHEENKQELNSGRLQIQEITDVMFDGYYGEHHKAFEKKDPILE